MDLTICQIKISKFKLINHREKAIITLEDMIMIIKEITKIIITTKTTEDKITIMIEDNKGNFNIF